MNEQFPYGSVKLTTLKKAIKQLEETYQGWLPEEEIEISFEYLIGSFFPSIMKNIENEVNRQYTLGYLAGKKASDENKGTK